MTGEINKRETGQRAVTRQEIQEQLLTRKSGSNHGGRRELNRESAYKREMRRRQRKLRRIRRIVCGTAAVAVTAVILFLAGRGIGVFIASDKTKETNKQGTAAELAMKEQLVPTVSPNENGDVRMAGETQGLTAEQQQEALRIYQANPQLLVLVNKDHALADDYNPALRSICNKRLKASEWLYQDLTRMLAAGSGEGHSFWIASAHRSRQRQQAVIKEDVRRYKKQGLSEEEALARTLEQVMPAGHSEHETGLALDILDSNNMTMDQTQENYAGNQWMREHCHEYGFILRYPKEKESITLIAYEPWHLRYVGIEAAAFMKEHNLTLEEFHQIIATASAN